MVDTGHVQTVSRKLSDDQLQAFDTDYLSPAMWENLTRLVKENFGNEPFSFLDVGGGNGRFTDSLLERFAKATGTVLDNGESILRLNKPHPRKRLVLSSAEAMDQQFTGGSFDLIHLNWVLHHFVGNTYRACKRLQLECLNSSRRLLTKRGKISVFENLYEGGAYAPLPSWLIYQLTSNRQIAPLTRRMGANTAGCGVCFLNESAWQEQFRLGGLQIQRLQRYDFWPLSWARRVFLQIKCVRVGHFWMSDLHHSAI